MQSRQQHLQLPAVKRLLVIALICAPAAAQASRLTLRVVAPAAVHVSLHRADAAGPAVERDLHPGEASVELPDGTWRLDASGAGLWHKRQYVTVPAGATTEVRLWPAAIVAGEIALAGSRESPDQLTIRFEVRDGPSSDETCAVAAKRFACAIPAGTADLALRVRGHVTQYVWSAPLATGATRDLGRLTFVRGATLAGRVDPPHGARINLETTTITASPAEAQRDTPLSSLSAHPNAKGFFHIDGIAAGEYDVVAAAARPRMSSSPARALIIAGAEATLSRPLVLSVPRPLTVNVDPPLDPWAKQWRIEINRYKTPRQYDHIADALVPMTGSYRSEPLHPGHYDVRIGAQDNGVWHVEELDVDDNTTSLLVPLQLARLHGTVHLGDKPLAATVWIGGERGLPRVEMHSDDTGEFLGFIPQRDGETWPVTVQSDTPMAKRNFSAVRLRRRDDGDLETELRLDLTMLQGDVVDEKGVPVPHARLNITAMGNDFADFVQPNSTPDGRFAVYGLRPGRYSISAMHYLRESRPVDVDVRTGEEPPLLRLVLLPNRQLKGVVRSAVGPVVGAKVTAWPTDVPGDLMMSAHSDETGSFAAIIAPGAEQLDVVVEPPGFALKFFHARWESNKMVVPVKQDGGTLTVDGVAPADAIIQHAGATLPLITLTYWPASSVKGERTTIGMLDPGTYTVCRARDRGACATGYLPPMGTLELEVRRAEARPTLLLP